jgi:hypothetical protein
MKSSTFDPFLNYNLLRNNLINFYKQKLETAIYRSRKRGYIAKLERFPQGCIGLLLHSCYLLSSFFSRSRIYIRDILTEQQHRFGNGGKLRRKPGRKLRFRILSISEMRKKS